MDWDSQLGMQTSVQRSMHKPFRLDLLSMPCETFYMYITHIMLFSSSNSKVSKPTCIASASKHLGISCWMRFSCNAALTMLTASGLEGTGLAEGLLEGLVETAPGDAPGDPVSTPCSKTVSKQVCYTGIPNAHISLTSVR